MPPSRIGLDKSCFYGVVLVLIAQVLGALLFAKGFFPLNEPSKDYGLPPRNQDGMSQAGLGFERLVFVLIDALRTDFIFGEKSEMNFTQSLIREGKALPFTAIAQSPTVTLPRLKAMTSGVNSQFIDALWNIAETSDGRGLLAHTDTWVRQIIFGHDTDMMANDSSEKNPVNDGDRKDTPIKRKAMMYGDDTWLRLFPKNWFEDHDGVTSFYVTDTEIVDHNVTRHLDDALSDHPQIDWDVLILHYLGLDHVGHLGGANSPLMRPKQKELDQVISRIYEKLSNDSLTSGKRSVLVVAGDHGMTDAGNHGGSSEGEVSAGLLFASPSFRLPVLNGSEPIKPKRVQQLDLVPTLSTLFRAGIPPASIGVAIESVLNATFLASSDTETRLVEDLLRQNALQLARTLSSAIGHESAYKLLPTTSADLPLEQVISKMDIFRIREFLCRAQDGLLEQFSGHQLSSMLGGLLILALVSSFFVGRSLRSSPTRLDRPGKFIKLGALCQLASLLSTSFIEEEHEPWFFLGSTSLLMLAMWPRSGSSHSSICSRIKYVIGSAVIRILRGWSQNGQKLKPNLSMSYMLQNIPWAFQILDFLGIVVLMVRWRGYRSRGIVNILTFTTLSFAGLLTLVPADHPGWRLFGLTSLLIPRHHQFQLIYILLLISFSVSITVCSRRQTHLNLRLVYLIFLRSLTKPINYVPLWLAFYSPELFNPSPFSWPETNLSHHLCSQSRPTPSPDSIPGQTETDRARYDGLILAWIQIVFAKCTFFGFGGSNSLATVDLSNAYNGLSSYALPIVTILTFFSNFAGPICISLGSLNIQPFEGERLKISELQSRASLSRSHLSAYQSSHLFMICLIGTCFSEHLFVYTVFSPAVLYGFVWTLFHYVMMFMNCVLHCW